MYNFFIYIPNSKFYIPTSKFYFTNGFWNHFVKYLRSRCEIKFKISRLADNAVSNAIQQGGITRKF